jgi:hypothetical protein
LIWRRAEPSLYLVPQRREVDEIERLARVIASPSSPLAEVRGEPFGHAPQLLAASRVRIQPLGEPIEPAEPRHQAGQVVALDKADQPPA